MSAPKDGKLSVGFQPKYEKIAQLMNNNLSYLQEKFTLSILAITNLNYDNYLTIQASTVCTRLGEIYKFIKIHSCLLLIMSIMYNIFELQLLLSSK